MTVDSLEEFRRKNEAQFAAADARLQDIARRYVTLLAIDIVKTTPGFGNQRPEDTEYIPTGRLRGGWNWSPTPFSGPTRWKGGPYSDYGNETIARIIGQLAGQRMGGISWIENDVAYGDLIVRGAGRHGAVGPRNWPYDTSRKAATFAAQAQQRAEG